MKKTISVIFAFCMSCGLFATGIIPIQTNQDSTEILSYTIDTVETYQVGPGVQYMHATITNGGTVRKIYVYDIDLNNQYNNVEESHHPNMGKTELMTAAHTRLDSACHRSIGSVNCNFWDTSSEHNIQGCGMTGQVRNGKIGVNISSWEIGYNDPLQSVGFCMIDRSKHAYIDQYSWDAKLIVGEESYAIRETNRNRNNPATNEIVLFNDLGENATRACDSSEVMVKMKSDWAINKDLLAEVVSIKGCGGTIIPEGYAVLQGRGKGKTFLDKLNIGDEVKINIGMYASVSEERPDIMQLLAGNCLVMVNGRLTPRNWNEDYNNRNYPRTGFATNSTHDRLWLMVMEKPGMFTHEMCSIFRYFGASFACGADGGGSAEFNLRGKIINPTTESSPRPVSNCMFIFSTAPEDSVPANLQFVENNKTTISSYASYKPQIRAYNQYGMLLYTDYQDYTLTCEPASLGTISEDGKTFIAGPNAGEGKLIVHTGDVNSSKDIAIEAGVVSLRLDSILTDGREYLVEVFSTVGDKKLSVDPSFVTWVIDDPTICSIENGALKGIKNGKTTIHGTLGDVTDDMDVTVEIPEAPQTLWSDMLNQEQWSLRASTGTATWDANTSGAQKPIAVLNVTNARGAFLEITQDIPFYGCPDSMSVTISTDAPISYITLTMNNPIKSEVLYKIDEATEAGGEHTYMMRPAEFTDVNDAARFPITMTSMKLTLGSIKKATDYHFTFDGITLYYPNYEVSAIPVIEADGSRSTMLIENGQIFILKDNKRYTLSGQLIR